MFGELSLTAIVAVFLATAALVGICGVLLAAVVTAAGWMLAKTAANLEAANLDTQDR